MPQLTRIRLTVLGGLDLTDAEGRECTRVLRQPKRVVLLAYVALSGRDRYVHRDELVARFWPDLDMAHARSALRTALSRVRAAVGVDPLLRRGSDSLRLNPDVVWCDAVAFADQVDADPEAALALYRGDLLHGVHAPGVAPELDQWIDQERAALRRRAADAAWRSSDGAERRGDLPAAVRSARRALDIAPHDEPGLRRLMALLDRAGDRAAALTAYVEFERRLARDLEAHPSGETRAAMIAIRGAAATPASGGSRSETPRSTGVETAAPSTAASAPLRRGPAAPVRWWRRYGVGGALAAGLLVVASAPPVRSRLTSVDANAALPDVTARWRPLPTTGSPARRFQSGLILDRSGDTAMLFGGRAGYTLFGDVWRLSGIVSGAGTWRRVRPAEGPAPAPRWLHGVAYSSPMDRLIVFGGSLGFTWPCANDVWLMDGVVRGRARWHPLAVTGPAPPPRADMTVTYDAASNSLLVFGGHDCVDTRYDDVWRLSFADGTNGAARWTRLAPRAPRGQPGPRSNHTAVYDPVGNRLIVFGGTDGRAVHNDVWLLVNANGTGGGAEWQPLATSGEAPPGRAYHAAAYDASANLMVVFAGSHGMATTVHDNGVWVLSEANGLAGLADWSPVTPAGERPAARWAPMTAFDALRQQLVVFGGLGAGPADVMGDLWLLRGTRR